MTATNHFRAVKRDDNEPFPGQLHHRVNSKNFHLEHTILPPQKKQKTVQKLCQVAALRSAPQKTCTGETFHATRHVCV